MIQIKHSIYKYLSPVQYFFALSHLANDIFGVITYMFQGHSRSLEIFSTQCFQADLWRRHDTKRE